MSVACWLSIDANLIFEKGNTDAILVKIVSLNEYRYKGSYDTRSARPLTHTEKNTLVADKNNEALMFKLNKKENTE